jgi:phage-related protein
MNAKQFIKTKGYLAIVGLVLSLFIILIYQGESNHAIVTNVSLPPEKANVNQTETQNTHEDSIKEIRSILANMNEQFSYQLAEIKKLSRENRQSISALRKLNEGDRTDDSAEFSYDSNAETAEVDPEQEQEVLAAETRRLAYMRQIDEQFMLQAEDASWSAQVESDFSSVLENYMGQIQLNSVSCGDSMCKISANIIVTDDASTEQLPPLEHIIHGDAQWQGQSLYEMDMDTGEITFYLMRDGVDLPKQQDWSS